MRRRARPASGRSLLARIATRSVDWERSEPKTAGRGFPWLFASGNDLSLKSPSRHHTSQDTTAHSDRSLIQPVGSAGTPGLSLAAKSPFTFLSSPPQVSAAPRQGESRPRLASKPRADAQRLRNALEPLVSSLEGGARINAQRRNLARHCNRSGHPIARLIECPWARCPGRGLRVGQGANVARHCLSAAGCVPRRRCDDCVGSARAGRLALSGVFQSVCVHPDAALYLSLRVCIRLSTSAGGTGRELRPLPRRVAYL